jgi:hypothetical protein
MTRGSDPGPGAGDPHPNLAQEAGTAVSAAALRLAYITGAPVVHAPPWPGASFTEEQPEPGAGIRIALALERAARAGVRVYIARAREAGMSWHEVGGALGVAELAQERGSSVAEAAWAYAAGRPAHLSGRPGEFRWTCPDCGEVVSDRGPGGRSPAGDEQGHAEGCHRLAAAVAQWLAQGD